MRKFSEQVKVVQSIMESLEKFQYITTDDSDISPLEIMGFEIKHVGITFNFVSRGGHDEINVFIANHILRGSSRNELVEAFLLTLQAYDLHATPRLSDGTSKCDYMDEYQLDLVKLYDSVVNSEKEEMEESDDGPECGCFNRVVIRHLKEAAKVSYK